jgi:dTDP-glucose 4,6-dehydratase
MITNKKVLITGADGFIGSHLTETLVRQGYNVKAFCCYNSFGHKGWLDHSDLKQEIEFILGDVRDNNFVSTAIKGSDIVFHLASLIAIPYSYHAPESYIETNITGTLNVMQACLTHGVEQVMHTSTSEVYGTAQYVPIDEKHPLVGQSPYSASKIGADQIATSFHRSFGLPLSIIRPFNTYGPRQSARAVIPTIITQILAGKEKILLGNLDSTRDFNYCLDTVGGMIASIGKERSFGEVINLGSNFEITIGDIARMIADIVGRKIELKVEKERLRPENSEVERLWASNDKARQILGWQPKYAGLEGLRRGLLDTVEWFKANQNSNFYNPDRYTI